MRCLSDVLGDARFRDLRDYLDPTDGGVEREYVEVKLQEWMKYYERELADGLRSERDPT